MSVSSKGKKKSAHMRAALSATTRGRPKPWNKGEANPNFGNRAQGAPGARERFLTAVKKRGQPWTEADRLRHGETMRGPSNKMRGRQHTSEMKARMSVVKRQQYADGVIQTHRYKLSKPEKEIAAHLESIRVRFKKQFHINGVPFLYDFFLPDTNTVVEFQGDYWHANPNKYSSGTMLNIQRIGPVLVDDIWARDEAKRLAAEERGYTVVHIWESDYKRLGMKVIECLIR